MAIDTAAKRAAALGVGMPPGVILPMPDGTVSAQDRAQLVGTYLPASASASIVPRYKILLAARQGAVAVPL